MNQLALLYGEDSLYIRNQVLLQRQRGVLRLFFSMVTSMSIMNGLFLSNAIFGTFLYIETRKRYNCKAIAIMGNNENNRTINEELDKSDEEYEILYILGHYYKKNPRTKKRIKFLMVQWLGFSPENGGIQGIPESYLIPNACALLSSYHVFCSIYGNPYLNLEKTKMVKEYLCPGVTGRSNKKLKSGTSLEYQLMGTNTLMANKLFEKLEKKGSYSNNTGFICSLQLVKGEKLFINKSQLEVLTWRKLYRKWSQTDYTVISHPLGINGINHNKNRVDMNKLKTLYPDLVMYIPFSAKRFKFLLNDYWKCVKPLIVLLFANGRIAQNRHALVCIISRDEQGFVLRYIDPWFDSSKPLTNLLKNTREDFSFSTTRSLICFGNQSEDKSCYKRAVLIISQLIDGQQLDTFGPWQKI